MLDHQKRPIGYRWRSSKAFILSCIGLSLFSENFLCTFIVPILPIILKDRLHLDPIKAQLHTSLILSLHALASFLSGPIIGPLADKIPSRKGPLVASLAGAIIGTTIVAASTSLPVLLIGRIIQATTGNAVFIIGFAAVASTVRPEDRPKTLQIITVVSMSGMLVGPVISGELITLFGYWPAWITVIAFLMIDMIMRLVMIDNPISESDQTEDEESNSETESSGETSRLLPEPIPDQDQPGYNSKYDDDQVSSESSMVEETKGSFYKVMLSNPHALTAMLCHGVNGLTLMTFDTTLPLYVMRSFQWDTQKISLMFLLLQLPTVAFSPLTTWLNVRYGTKITASVGFSVNAILIWFIGNCGPDGLPFVDSGKISRDLYAASIFFIGVFRALVVGCGVVELTSIVAKLQGDNPGIFGKNGGYSRTFSLTNMSYSFAKFVGPIISGGLVEAAGYYYMNLCLGMLDFTIRVSLKCFTD
ncbi:MFS transporter [Penicillium angulare]|uniref:MFS transporter n=1 Tax=Penicillium angulare TaxID=116970 RepID=A0A9W9FBB5_9EURO|nr:MFS transporter [Penicillium angulare]